MARKIALKGLNDHGQGHYQECVADPAFDGLNLLYIPNSARSIKCICRARFYPCSGGSTIFQQLFERPHAIKRHLTGPLLEDRLRYLDHNAKQGATTRTLRVLAIYLLTVTKYLPLTAKQKISHQEIAAAAARSAQHQARRYRREEHHLSYSEARFRGHALRWLSFLDHLEIPRTPPVVPEVAAFLDYLRDERGLCEETVEYRRRTMEWFLKEMSDRGYRLAQLTLAQVDSLLLKKYRQGHWVPSTIQTQASGLRSFFSYAENRRWCRSGISCGIQTPRDYHHASLPSGPTWDEVQQLIKTTAGNRPIDLRDRAIFVNRDGRSINLLQCR